MRHARVRVRAYGAPCPDHEQTWAWPCGAVGWGGSCVRQCLSRLPQCQCCTCGWGQGYGRVGLGLARGRPSASVACSPRFPVQSCVSFGRRQDCCKAKMRRELRAAVVLALLARAGAFPRAPACEHTSGLRSWLCRATFSIPSLDISEPTFELAIKKLRCTGLQLGLLNSSVAPGGLHCLQSLRVLHGQAPLCGKHVCLGHQRRRLVAQPVFLRGWPRVDPRRHSTWGC